MFGKKHKSSLDRTLGRMARSPLFRKHRDKIRQLQADARMRTALAQDVDGLAQSRGVAAFVAALEDTPAQRRPLLAWLWEHREQILELILKIVALFAAMETSKATARTRKR